MSLTAVLYTLSSVPLFASRPFLAAFLTALVSRFGPSLPLVGDHAIVTALHAGPPWFQSATCLTVLGVLALLEVFSAKSTEVRQVLDQVDGLAKAVIAALVALAVIDSDTARTAGAIQRAGLSLDTFWAIFIGAATWAMANLRRSLVELVTDVDDGDDLGLLSLLAWSESTATLIGVLFLIVFPILALVLAALTVAGIWLVRRRAEAREERAKVACARCATPIFPHAVRCHACGLELAEPRAVGVFGQPKERPCADRARQPLELSARKRCPVCATRLRQRAVSQACPTCRTVTFGSPAELERYLELLRGRLPKTLLVTLALGAVPVLGVVPGVIYYRLNLVAGLRGYIPPLRGCATRWMVSLIHLALVVQPIPVVGALVLPILCWSTYAIYQRSLRGSAAELAPAAA